MNNLVTVCITTYNRSNLLPATIKSVQNQTYKNLEIIVVDDFSKDDTSKVVQDFLNADNRIRYIRHNENKGLASARNTAIFNAKGKYFTFCDDDDIWKENFVEEFVKLAEIYNENFCFCCGTINIASNNSEVTIIPDFQGSMREIVRKGYTPPVAAQFYYTKMLQQIGGYNTYIRTGVDHDLWISLAEQNVEIVSLQKALSIPNFSNRKIKMTMNFNNRIEGLKNSLFIWEEKLVNMYGRSFFEKFSRAYIEREYEKFFLNFIKEKKYGNALSILNNINKINLISRVLRKFIKSFNSNKKSISIMSPILHIDK